MHGLGYDSSEQAVPHRSESSAIDLSLPQSDRPKLSCRNEDIRRVRLSAPSQSVFAVAVVALI